ncbi:MAG: TonB-dependent receptor [Calditrichaeota bacterium]|nr:MAG: TonB-dependent receptor [Calditrichota bacterium]
MGAATNANGYYNILNVPPGTYTLHASMIGYKNMDFTSVLVRIDLTTSIDIKMTETVLDIGETVTVVAERPLVQKDITSGLAVVNREEISAMPVQELNEVLSLQAGITEDAGGHLHFRGGRAGEVAFLIDGISVTDPYDRGVAIEVENNSVQELVAVSGTFNAEYGQALSGIVDIATREGGNKFSGEINLYSGDYLSRDEELFFGIDDLDPFAVRNVQATLSGPLPGFSDKLTFFLTGRYHENDGWLWGQRRFLPGDSSSFEAPNIADWYIEESGDGAIVPMNNLRKYSGHGKLSWRITPVVKLAYTFLGEDIASQGYNHLFKLNPEGNLRNFETAQTHIFSLSHTLSSNTFYTVRSSFFNKEFRSYVFENPIDSRYVNPQLLRRIGSSFHTGGTLMNHFNRQTETWNGKFELTSQLHPAHLVKAGAEFRRHKLELHDITIRFDRDTGWKPFVDPVSTFNNNQYSNKPQEFSFYLQDKIEWQDMIVNAGLRFDWFDPNYVVPVELRDPKNSEKKSADIKMQLSPRVGIAYPITDRGVIHASYGHFFQMPAFDYLYQNSEFEIFPGRLVSKIGNANLEPERTIAYEVGLRQQLGQELAIDITGYFKDIRNLLGTEIHELFTLGDKYARYINRDFGNVRGITFTLNNRSTSLFVFSLDYTFQIAEGNASDPESVFLDNQTDPPIETEKRVVPLDWDRSHILNFQVGLSRRPSWGVNLLGKMWSGLPYTPAAQGTRLLPFENSARRPTQYTFDVRAFYGLNLAGLTTSFYFNIDNLFDHRNEIIVFSDTGRAGRTLLRNPARGPNTVDEFLIRPDFYSPPRQVTVGMAVKF